MRQDRQRRRAACGGRSSPGYVPCWWASGWRVSPYTPLLPALIQAGWFGPAEAAYLGAVNLLGYLVGALLARWMARRMPAAVALRAMMLAATVAFVACAFPNSFAWFVVCASLPAMPGAC